MDIEIISLRPRQIDLKQTPIPTPTSFFFLPEIIYPWNNISNT